MTAVVEVVNITICKSQLFKVTYYLQAAESNFTTVWCLILLASKYTAPLVTHHRERGETCLKKDNFCNLSPFAI